MLGEESKWLPRNRDSFNREIILYECGFDVYRDLRNFAFIAFHLFERIAVDEQIIEAKAIRSHVLMDSDKLHYLLPKTC